MAQPPSIGVALHAGGPLLIPLSQTNHPRQQRTRSLMKPQSTMFMPKSGSMMVASAASTSPSLLCTPACCSGSGARRVLGEGCWAPRPAAEQRGERRGRRQAAGGRRRRRRRRRRRLRRRRTLPTWLEARQASRLRLLRGVTGAGRCWGREARVGAGAPPSRAAGIARARNWRRYAAPAHWPGAAARRVAMARRERLKRLQLAAPRPERCPNALPMWVGSRSQGKRPRS